MQRERLWSEGRKDFLTGTRHLTVREGRPPSLQENHLPAWMMEAVEVGRVCMRGGGQPTRETYKRATSLRI